MKILITGDSITDMNRHRDAVDHPYSFGMGYPFFVEGELSTKFPNKYQVLNRGISGNRIVDLYARINIDCWKIQPDLITILIGVNDVWHGFAHNNGVDLDRYERVYRMFIEDTRKVMPDVKFMLLEPFFLKGTKTEQNLDEFSAVYDYAKVVEKIANYYGLVFVPLQERFNELAKQTDASYYLFDGIHPTVAGAKIISEEWLKAFYKNFTE